MSKFTPGPWEAQILEHHAPYITSKRHGDEVGTDCVATMNPQLGVAATANARLSAAAPDLLRLVKAFETYLSSDAFEDGLPPGAPYLEDVLAVIAKAEGE